MRLRRGNNRRTGTDGAEILEKQPATERTAKVNFHKGFFKFLCCGPNTIDIIEAKNSLRRPAVVLTFEENLAQGHLSLAGKQLIQREKRLFGGEKGKEDEESRENKEKLEKDYEALLKQTWLSVDSSLSAGAERLEGLKSAVSCIQQEEEQDRRWTNDPGEVCPEWRPRRARQTHDALLEKMVERRMEELEGVIGCDSLSSVKKDICKMGVRAREDLLKVARDLRNCYPEEFDIGNMYTRLYHQAFSKRLMQISEFVLDVDECAYVLSWVNTHYANEILKHSELREMINCCNSLGDLLSVEVTRALEEQYLSDKETEVKTWLSTALRKQEETWLSGAPPELIEGYYSPISIDVIQCVDVAVRAASMVVGEPHGAQRIMCQMQCFLMSYKKSLEDFLKGKHGNTKAVIKANLASLQQFENYIAKESEFFSEETKAGCLSIINAMKDCGYQYLSNIIHENMKVRYRKLGTQSWLTGNSVVMRELLGGLRGHIEECRDLEPSCREELIGRLHRDMMVEYVKRLLKGNLRLRGEGQQETAASLLCEDSKKLNEFFTEEGSKEEWLRPVLPKIAEVLKTLDPSIIQLEIVTLARDFPDLSDHHVSALLHLRTTLSAADVRKIRASLSENRNPVIPHNAKAFFSRVQIRLIMRLAH